MESFKLNVLIVEDNFSFAIELAMLVEEIGYNVIGMVDNSKDALELIINKKPEIVLMDHHLKGEMTGLELGEKIKPLRIPILYITAFGSNEHYNDAKKSNMIGYLVKPVEKITLHTTLELALQNAYLKNKEEQLPNNNQINPSLSDGYLFIKKKGVFHKLMLTSIAYISSDDNYLNIVTINDEEFVVRLPMSKIEEMLPTKDFMRTHRQYIIRLDRIQTFDPFEEILVVAGHKIPVSRTKRKELTGILKMLD